MMIKDICPRSQLIFCFIEIHKRNIYVVLINKENKILAGVGSPTDIIEINEDGSISSTFKEDVKAFITNNSKNPNSSDLIIKRIANDEQVEKWLTNQIH